MSDLNDVIIEGRLGDDPYVKEGNNGKWASFSVAVNKSYKDKNDEWVEKTNWISVMCYKKLAEIVESKISKGDHITLKGELQVRDYMNKQDQKVYVTEVIANMVRKNTRNAKTEEAPKAGSGGNGPDDMPF
tara:strand:+ start:35867 stop:36259 length:393 start_codon:yes stop_codon:yes gene_type:complete